jgi:ferric-dicitrate binding protein FerR (iron transport regulator)
MRKDRYTVEDLLADASFQRYAYSLLGDEDTIDISETRQFWEDRLALHPENRVAAQEAIELIKQLRQAEAVAVAVPNLDGVWQKVQARLQKQAPVAKTLTFGWRVYLRYAAAILFLLSTVALSLYFYFLVPVEISTEIGSNQTITLPDRSTVVLSGNSSLRYARYWPSNRPREVWLKGKAYFDVTHAIHSNNSFVVYAGKARIEVLGTTFDVTNRDEAVKVLLKTGKVKMQAEATSSQETPAATVLMPGEEAELSTESGLITKKTANMENSMHWIQQKFVFDNTPFEEVAKTIEENCGVKVTIRRQELLSRRITAHLESKNLDVFLTGIARLFDAKVKRKGDSVVFY